MKTNTTSVALAASLAALCATACIEQQQPPSIQAPAVKNPPQVSLSSRGPYAVPPDSVIKGLALTYTGSQEKPFLPKWKTNWELTLERLTKEAKAKGLPFADSYSDYRKNNFDKFFITKAPLTTGLRAPAEFEPSRALIINWRNRSSNFTGAWRQLFVDMIKGAWGVVPLLLVYEHAKHKYTIEQELLKLGYKQAEIAKNVTWFKHATDGIWVRDWGPMSIVTTPKVGPGTLSIVDFRYYHARVHDDELPTSLAQDWGVNVFRPDLDFEGGNFMNTSDGLCAVTKGLLWFNSQYTQSAIEQLLTDYLGCKKVLMAEPMKGAIEHIDMFAKFASDSAMIVGQYTAAQHAANAKILDANAKLFETTPTPGAKKIKVTRIPMPDVGSSGGYSVWRTYTNSTAVNNGKQKVLLIPTYSDEATKEKAAMAAYAAAFPGWTQVKIDSKVVIPSEGAIHCITMQIPKGTKAKMEAAPKDLCGVQQVQCKTSSCGNITTAGCCDGTKLMYCLGGKINSSNCSTNPKCGWDSKTSLYKCGTTGGADPSSKNVKNCGVLTDAAVPDAGPDKGSTGACGQVTNEGCCDGQTLYYCDNSTLKKLSCSSNPSCGWDSSNSFYDCGTSGGADPAGKHSKSCSGKIPDGGVTSDGGGTTGCGKITTAGCCDGSSIKYCDNGALKSIDCSGNPKCGWSASSSYYDCGTAGGADPSGKNPLKCGGATGDSGPAADSSAPDLASADQSAGDLPAADQAVAQADGASGKDGGGGKKDDEDEGCSCTASGSSPTPASGLWLLLGLGAALLARRRG